MVERSWSGSFRPVDLSSLDVLFFVTQPSTHSRPVPVWTHLGVVPHMSLPETLEEVRRGVETHPCPLSVFLFRRRGGPSISNIERGGERGVTGWDSLVRPRPPVRHFCYKGSSLFRPSTNSVSYFVPDLTHPLTSKLDATRPDLDREDITLH